MATKNLAKSLGEGGWCREHVTIPRKRIQRAERTAARAYLRRVTVDPSFAEIAEAPEREYDTGSCPSCRSSALVRWIERRIGRAWDTVFAELVHRFDRRTNRGRHLIDYHVLGRGGYLDIGLVVPEVVARQVTAQHPRDDFGIRFIVTADGVLARWPRA